jgi:tetratricopeptide (TPR) repeat protein
MDRTEIQGWLTNGIQAIRAGDRARGRELLLRVVAADERNEPAWLWLSAVMDHPRDQLTALENVLTLNPANVQARTGVAKLRQQLGLQEPAESESDATGIAPAPPAEVIVATPTVIPKDSSAAEVFGPDEDDPWQCAYCGQPTIESEERCPQCGKSLLVPGFWRGGGYQYVLLILVGLLLQSAMVQTAAAYVLTYIPRSIEVVPLADLVAASPLVVAAARTVLWGIILMMLLGDSLDAYRWAAVIAASDLIWQIAGFGLGLVGRELAIFNGLMGVFVGVGGLGATIGQMQSRRRLRVVPDRGLNSAPLFEQRAAYYGKRGMWALAAVHWQKAIARQPREPAYYKSLGATQARLGRYAQAVKTFRSGAELAPADPEFERLIGSVRATTRMS